MGALTSLYRLPPEVLEKLDVQSVRWVFGWSDDDSIGAALGYGEGERPPRTEIDKSWEYVRGLLSGTGQMAASAALHGQEYGEIEGADSEYFPPRQVQKGAAALVSLQLDEVEALALQREPKTEWGYPVNDLLDYTLHYLKTVTEFWNEAAKAGEGIISKTS